MSWLSDAWNGLSDAATDLSDSLGLKGPGDWLGDQIGDLFAFKFFDEPEPPEPPPLKLQLYGANNARQVIYGRARVGGVIAFIESTTEEQGGFLDVVIVFASHPCESVQNIYIDDVLIDDPKYDGLISSSINISGVTAPASDIMYQNTQLDPDRHKFLGLSYGYFRFTYNAEVFRGIPKINFEIEGKNDIFDPRVSSSGYSTNHVLCSLDWLTNYVDTTALFDTTTWNDAADFADELVAGVNETTEPRYTVNGSIAISGSRIDALTNLTQAGNLQIIYQQGQWFCLPARYSAPVGTINESNLSGSFDIDTGADKQSKFNTARGTFIDPAQSYEPVDFIALTSATYIEQDKEELPRKFDFRFHNTPALSRRTAKVKLEKSRFGLTVKITCNLSALEYSVGDRVYFDYARYGWDQNKIFRIENIEWSPLTGIQLTLKQDDPQIYSWEEGDVIDVTVPPVTNLPDPFIVNPPTNLTGSEELYFTNVGAVIKTRVNLTWQSGGVTTRNFELEGSLNGGNFIVFSDYILTESFEIEDVEPGSWVFRVRASNNINVKSTYTSFALTVLGKTAPPQNVTGFNGTVTPYSIDFDWNPVEDIDIDVYQIRLGATWETGTVLNTIKATQWKWELRPEGTEQIFIKAIDTSGNESDLATQANIIINPPNLPSGLNAQVIDNFVQLRWGDATNSFAIREYEIRRGPVLESAELIGTSQSTFNLVFETEAGEYRYWISGIDIKGNQGPFNSIDANVDQPPDFVLQADQFLNFNESTGDNFDVEGVRAEYTADSVEWTADSTSITMDSEDATVILAPVLIGETWQEHFEKLPGWQLPEFRADNDTIKMDSTLLTVDEGFQSFQDLHIDNGYPIYLQPTPPTAFFENVVDFQGLFTISRIQVTPTIEQVEGFTATQVTIGYSADNITYIDTVANEVVGKDFRYVRVRIDYSTNNDTDFSLTRSVRLKLDVKLRNDSGAGTALGTEPNGTQVNFNVPFVDINSIQVTPNLAGATAQSISAVYDFLDVPNPTSFDVYLYDSAGTRIGGDFTWQARGV